MLHIFGSLRILYEDVEHHSMLNKGLLFLSLTKTASTFFCAVRAAMDKEVALHRDLMMEAFIRSLGGAGTIRTVGSIQTALGVGPALCEVQHLNVGGHCDWTYSWRLCWTNMLTLFQIGAYYQFNADFIGSLNEHLLGWPLVMISFAIGLDQEQTLMMIAVTQIGANYGVF